MKPWITLVAAVAVFASCSKENLQAENSNSETSTKSGLANHAASGVYVSEWEHYNDWSERDSADTHVYSRKRSSLPVDYNTGGALLVFAKMITVPEKYQTYYSPRLLPYVFRPEPVDRPRRDIYLLQATPSANNVFLAYNKPLITDGGVEEGLFVPTNFQFRYVAFSAAFLSQNNLTANALKGYTYDQIMRLTSG